MNTEEANTSHPHMPVKAPSTLQAEFDVIVIGGGLSGMSAASYLSSKGVKTALCERRKKLGGFVHTFKRGQFTFEASTHQSSGYSDPSYMTQVLKLLNLEDIRPVKSDHLYESVLFDPNYSQITKRYILPAGMSAIESQLISYFPESIDEIKKYFAILKLCGRDAMKLKSVSRVPKQHPISAIFALMLKSNNPQLRTIGLKRFRAIKQLAGKTYADVLKMISDPSLQWVLSTLTPYFGSSSEQLNGFLMTSLNYSYFDDGPYLFYNGSNTIIDGLQTNMKNTGAALLLNDQVTNILVNETGAYGITTASGKQYNAKIILSAINVNTLFSSMIGHSHINSEYREKCINTTHTLSAFQVFLGLDINIRDYGFVAPTTFFDPTINNSERIHLWETALTPESRSTTPFILTNYADVDLGLAPEGFSTVSIVELCPMDDWDQLSPEQYELKKQRMQDTIIEKVERVTGIPIRQHIKVAFSGTPRTMRHYGMTPDGAILGAIVNNQQSFKNRTQPKSQIKNLFLTGSSVGFAGVSPNLDSGIQIGNMILKELKHKRRC